MIGSVPERWDTDAKRCESPAPSMSTGRVSSEPDPIMRTGVLTIIRRATFGTSSQLRRRTILCAPKLTDDLHPILQEIFPDTTPASSRALKPLPHVTMALGRITQAAIKGTPLLIFLPEETMVDGDLETKPVYVELSSVVTLRDEVDMNETCTFGLELKNTATGGWAGKNMRIRAGFSLEYLGWMAVLREAMNIGATPTLAYGSKTAQVIPIKMQREQIRGRSMVRHSEMDLRGCYGNMDEQQRISRSLERGRTRSAQNLGARMTDLRLRQEQTIASAGNQVHIPHGNEQPSSPPLAPVPRRGRRQGDNRPPPAMSNRGLCLPALRRVSWHGDLEEGSMSDLVKDWGMSMLVREPEAEVSCTVPIIESESYGPEPSAPVPSVKDHVQEGTKSDNSFVDNKDRPISTDSGIGSSVSGSPSSRGSMIRDRPQSLESHRPHLDETSVPKINRSTAMEHKPSLPRMRSSEEHTSATRSSHPPVRVNPPPSKRRPNASLNEFSPRLPPTLPASRHSASAATRPTSQARYSPVTLRGSPPGPPTSINPVPIISLADSRGPRIWSVKRNKWVALHERVPVNRIDD
ncbi:uncharacterized protein SPPG_08122 [Spizellomyces punctatus DAOM BR117]|uniref:Uncharacterized protein n=1 Tax=Spizellomyces punctatus (strain DAOM BR117) TaxID=645134 RepID=A0A0L0H6D3_SPIPD|nr:uncharacterized protein SPPG_08122 [Spizellomyces punctatus DAOM BR117]KNC96534.1 hypothetical protein SPPG_08122 [Spizellomyces punctatus DAOM BR117]|eukprot:XP_016604574.1 hypothetical protein SPPG_08122 [Spizellomyces punctatus DAOM BR117]